MSHINDLIGVVRGLRLVAEAGVKLQQEHSRLFWKNSSFRPMLTSCPTTNTLTAFKPNTDTAQELLDRALVVAHGFRKYAQMHIPNYSPEVEKTSEMDPNLRSEIEELNREFNKTFETLEYGERNSGFPEPPVATAHSASAAPNAASSAHSVTPVQQLMQPTQEAQMPAKDSHSIRVKPDDEKAVPKPVARKKVSMISH